MTTILFWNINKKPILEQIVTLSHTYNVDILLLAESSISNDSLEMALNEGQKALYFPDYGPPNQLQIYSRFFRSYFIPIYDRRGIAIRHLIPPIGRNILIITVHLPSKIYQNEIDQIFGSGRLANDIAEAEEKVGHNHTVLIGDLNMDPFEPGIVAADGLHALSDRGIVKRGSRKVGGVRKNFFYNPMWNFFGDMYNSTPGTYYFDSGKQVNIYWHMFDQILIRPSLLNGFRKENVRIITDISGVSLLTESGKPNLKDGSDHLPIILTLDL